MQTEEPAPCDRRWEVHFCSKFLFHIWKNIQQFTTVCSQKEIIQFFSYYIQLIIFIA